MIEYNEFQKALQIVNDYKKQIETHYNKVFNEVYDIGRFITISPDTPIRDVDCSRSLLNSLIRYYHKFGMSGFWESKVSDLAKISESKFSHCYGVGPKTLIELKELCLFAGISLQ